jgi:hypothetical protein
MSGGGEDYIAAIRTERDMQVRLLHIQALVERHLWKPAFRRAFINVFEVADASVRAGDLDVSVPGYLSGLEFVMVSAVSRVGVASDKTVLSNLLALAVPQERRSRTPVLHVVSTDTVGTFAISGLCLAIVGMPEGYSAEDVRIFWSMRTDITHPGQLMRRLTPLKTLTRAEAKI